MKTEVVSTKDIKNLGPVFGQLSFQDHEQIVFCNDKDTGLMHSGEQFPHSSG